MSTMSVRLPESLHRQLREWAKKDKVSVNQFIATAVAEKLSALSTLEILEARARQGSREKFDAALAQVPDIEPAVADRFPLTNRKARPNAAPRRRNQRKN